MRRPGLNRPTAIAVASLLASIGVVLALVQVERRLDGTARSEQRARAALTPVAIESAGDAGRLGVEEFDPRSQEAGRPLPTRVTGLVAPPQGGGPLAGTGWRHQWPGVYFEARFRGDTVALAFDGPHNRYRVALDGGTGPVVLLNRSGSYGVRLSGLGPGPHEVRVDRISESLAGAGTFGGAFVPSEADVLPPPPAPARAVEFIGDSDSVGFGNMSESRDCTGEEVFLLTDTQASFGPRVARHFGADYQLNAVSGIGLVRDDLGAAATMMPLHGRALIDAAAPLGAAGWSPDLIVIALGSNDFASETPPSGAWADPVTLRDGFARQYVRFLLDLRRQHPSAFLLALAWEEYGPDYLSAHRAALAELREAGDTRLDLLVLPPMTKTGCLWHPNLADHEAVAEDLIRYVEARPEIWAG